MSLPTKPKLYNIPSFDFFSMANVSCSKLAVTKKVYKDYMKDLSLIIFSVLLTQRF